MPEGFQETSRICGVYPHGHGKMFSPISRDLVSILCGKAHSRSLYRAGASTTQEQASDSKGASLCEARDTFVSCYLVRGLIPAFS